jgi:hypothetical protein
MLAIPLTLVGCWLYVASGLVGEGVHLGPMPGWGMLFATGALLIMIGGYFLIRAEKPEYILAAIINIVLGLGGLSLLYGGLVWVYETIHHAQSSQPPGELLFRVSYGALSVVSFVIFNVWVRKSNTIPIHSRPMPD